MDRRPIKAREYRWSQKIAEALARKGISANAISIAGMFIGILAGVLLAATSRLDGIGWSVAWLAAGLLTLMRLLCNMWDGMVALLVGKGSTLGEIINEVPDRVSDSAILIGLGYAGGGSPEAGLLAALAAMFTAYVRSTGKAVGAPNDFCGPMAKPHRMFVVIAVSILMAIFPGLYGIPRIGLWIIVVGSLITAVRRLTRIMRAIASRPA